MLKIKGWNAVGRKRIGINYDGLVIVQAGGQGEFHIHPDDLRPGQLMKYPARRRCLI